MTAGGRTIAITGASGMIGRHLCDHFRRGGWHVRALMRDTKAYPFAEAGIQAARATLPDGFDEAAVRGADVVIHAAYATRARNEAEARRVNVDGTARVLAAARSAGVRQFIFISSMSAHAGAKSFYGRSKWEIERTLDPTRDLVVRPGLVLARDDGLAGRLARSLARVPMAPIFDGGRQMVQTVHIDDLCAAMSRAIEMNLTGAVNVAEPVGLPMRELLRLMARAAGRRPLLVPVPSAPAIALLRLAEGAGMPLPVSSENVLGLTAMTTVDTSADLARLGITVRAAAESIRELYAA